MKLRKLPSGNRTAKVSGYVPPEIKKAVWDECYKRSGPGEKFTESDLLLEILEARYGKIVKKPIFDPEKYKAISEGAGAAFLKLQGMPRQDDLTGNPKPQDIKSPPTHGSLEETDTPDGSEHPSKKRAPSKRRRRDL